MSRHALQQEMFCMPRHAPTRDERRNETCYARQPTRSVRYTVTRNMNTLWNMNTKNISRPVAPVREFTTYHRFIMNAWFGFMSCASIVIFFSGSTWCFLHLII